MTTIGLTTRDVARELARRYSTMTHDELDVLESILVPMKFQKGEIILKEGDICTNIYWVVKGLVRQYYYKNGKKYAHTIDPKTGYPVQHNILSSTVFADNCATADAYATAFMVTGLDGAKKILAKHPELMAYFIYADQNGKNAVWYSPKLRKKIVN